MYPTKEELEVMLTEKMTNKDIADVYGLTFQKVIQLIKKYKLKPDELRKVNNFIVYEHWLDNKVVYVGSGVWYRMRRYTNRRNLEHRRLMREGKIRYRVVCEFENEKAAREYESILIKKYKSIGQAKFNKHT